MSIHAEGNSVSGNGFQHIGHIYNSDKPLSPEEEEEEIARVLLESLRFPSIEDRYNNIRPAYAKMFQWIFHDPEGRKKSWDNFAKWLGEQRLGENDGLYWIGGKAGSGKSTLMRYLFDNIQTRELLQKWSGEDKPLLVSFFFWRSSMIDDQASQEGLRRSLLYDILRQKKYLLKDVCQDTWQMMKSSKEHNFNVPRNWWNFERIHKAFDNLCEVDLGKVCFLIDGLDECTGNHMETINILRSITQKSANIKICASSRPEVVFMNQFDDDPKLLLQDLTFDDIKLYVSKSLHKDEKMKALYYKEKIDALKLEEEIVTAAKGVFLWVRLVVNSLLTGLGNRDDITQLRKRLVGMPAEIEDLYKHMLKNIDETYAQDAVRIFRIMSIAQHTPTRPIKHVPRDIKFQIPELTALELSFALDKNQDFAINPTPIVQQDLEMRMKNVDIQLRKSCAGLLEVSGRKYFRRSVEGEIYPFSKDPSAKIEYHHRTAKDFLDGEDLQELMVKTQQADRFSPSTALVRARLVIYQSLCTGVVYRTYKTVKEDWNILKSIDATLILALQAENETGKGQVEYIDKLNKTIEGLWYPNAKNKDHWGEHISFDQQFSRHSCWHDDFLAVAVTYGLHHYVAQKLGNGNSVLRKKKGRPYLDYAPFHTLGNPGIYSPDTVKVLLDHGAEPNKTFDRRSPWCNFLERGLIYPETAYQIMELLLKSGADRSMAKAAVKQYKLHELDSDSKEKMLTLISECQQNPPKAKDEIRALPGALSYTGHLVLHRAPPVLEPLQNASDTRVVPEFTGVYPPVYVCFPAPGGAVGYIPWPCGVCAVIVALLFEAFFVDETLVDVFDATLLSRHQEALLSPSRTIFPAASNSVKSLGPPTEKAVYGPFSFRQIAEFVLFLPLNFIPFVGVPLFLVLTGRRAGPLQHWRYFKLRGLGRKERNKEVESRRWGYTWFGTIALLLQLVPVLSMFFLLTSAAGSALWAADLEEARQERLLAAESVVGGAEVNDEFPPEYTGTEDQV
ncbi:hypothetical protein V502_03736 [Pseudogymnoascus sp. VKM F-4520 (FW-2644)]|nr:hypothetical protein V502_03736 [Pseudogymnoascus sp. VKM F-4520 (FW-2644)]